MEKITAYLIQSTVHTHEVRAWQEDILLPTYEIGEEEKNPIFLEKRVYQGSCGSVYPYPVVEKISDEKKDKLYHAFFIENEYIKVMILPELGGRVHMAYDKVKNRHFVYYNQVVKPALVGLTGPWISGGIEFNWPQHHRPSTFLPTDCSIEEHADGSKTIWCSEVERMFRTKGMQGFRLYPGKSYIEIEVKVYNRTAFPQTFLWWANPAVVVNDHYHSVFPPDVNAVFDHGKRDVSSFPIATGVYYKQDYSAGVDISKYKNIPVPTSYMAIRSKFDFVGGYEEHIGAGLLHVADHHVSPGKKQWTWGNGDFGQAWDRNLTDEDGPYIELMTGVYTDNQPDFTWLQPYEEKSWKQYFMPYSEVGYVKNATKDAVLHVSVAEGNGKLILYTTSEMKNVCVKVVSVKTGQVLLEETIARIAPEAPYAKVFEALEVADADMKTVVLAADGVKLLEYQADQPEIKPVPDPARAAKDPKDIASIEQLFLTGLHLEQYRHATYNPLDYYEEALRREPGDVRCNNAVGLWLMRKGQFAKAEPYFKKAIETLTERNPNPYDGEPYYNLGWCCEMQGRYDDAYDAFYKSAWNAAWQDAAYYAVARIDTRKGAYERALEEVERSLVRNWHNHKARQLKATLLRKLGRKEEALAWVNASLELDRFNMGCAFEKMLLLGGNTGLESEGMMLRRTAHDYLEYAFDFMGAGLYQEAFDLLSMYEKAEAAVYPMVYYALGYCCCQMGDSQQGCAYYAKGEQADHRYCFPNKLEEVLVLQAVVGAIEAPWALYCLGNFWYASRQYAEATQCWEEAGRLNENIPTVWRNLSLVYYNKQGNVEKALEALEKAYQLDEQDGRILMELDQLYKRLGRPYAERLALLEKHLDLVDVRDDLAIERITLYNQLGRFEEARQLIAARRFHPWEGGEGKITGQYAICHTELAKQAITAGNYREALDLLNATNVYPHNLGEGKLINAEENDIWYYKGLAYRGLQQEDEAVKWFKMAVTGSSEPQQAFFYNDQQPDKIFYQGLAWRALGQEDKARSCFNKLIAHGEKHLFDTCRIDYFAVSLPDLAIWEDDLNKRNRIHCEYVMGLGYMGLGEVQTAARWLNEVHRLDINHQGVQLHLNLLTHPVG